MNHYNKKGNGIDMEKYRLHTGWTFCLDERNEKEETAPSEGFRAVTLPHDWSTDYPFDPESDTCGSGGYAKAGIGWYQRTITISENDIKSRQIILYFEGVYMKSSVFVNGTYAGGHIYGYTPFEVDITALVHEGENEILVRVDNSMQPGSRWYSGSGITRDVWLEKRHPIHIARYGMYLTTDEGNLNISTTLHTSECMKNDDSLSLNFVLKDNDGAEIAKKNIELKNDWMEADLDAAILSGMDEDVPKTLCQLQTSLSIQVENPVLWDHETPYLYELTTILKKNDTVIDERTDKVGFRNMLTVRVVTLVSSRLVTVWVTTQKCASLNSLTTTKTWLRKKWLRKLPVPVVQRRALLPKLLPLLKLHRLPKLLLLKKQKQNNSTILFIYRKPSQRLGRLFCLRFYHFYGKH